MGYSRVNDRWVRTDEFMAAQGYVRHRGSWRIAQEVALEKEADEIDRRQKDWRRKVRSWQTAIEKARGKELEALAAIRGITDPYAGPALAEIVEDGDAGRDLRLLCIDVLGKLQSLAGTAAFIRCAAEDHDATVCDAALHQLTRFGTVAAQRAFEKLLHSPDNKKVLRAGHCLGILRRPDSTLPLINALVTEHKYQVQTGGSPGSLNLGFGGGPSGGGNSFGVGGRPQIVKRQLQNETVLNALVAIHPGVNFGYDVDAWKDWYTRQSTPPTLNLRPGRSDVHYADAVR